MLGSFYEGEVTCSRYLEMRGGGRKNQRWLQGYDSQHSFLVRLQDVEKIENSWHHEQVLVRMESIHYLANSIVRL